MWITAGLKLISEALGLANNLTNGDNKEKLLHVAMKKNMLKALNLAEDYFDIIRDNWDKLPDKVQKKLRKIEKQFDNLD